ncbi:MAG: DNA cytosine methyltransferase [Anaerocolumna sp.]
MKELTHLSLFTGIGGLDLAAEWAGFKTVGQCEWKDYQNKILEKHWPGIPRWRDIRELSAREFIQRTGIRAGELTAISGGFPCQPFSVAGNQKGKEDERYLWPEMHRVIGELHPTYILGENVPGILHIAADDVCKDMEREGYEVGIFNYEAAAVGAVHRRERFFFVAHSRSIGRTTGGDNWERRQIQGDKERYIPKSQSEWDEWFYRAGQTSPDAANTKGKGLQERNGNREKKQPGFERGSKIMANTNNQGLESTRHESREYQTLTKNGIEYSSGILSNTDNRSELMRRNGGISTVKEIRKEWLDNRGRTPEHVTGEWWAVEPELGRVANGISDRVDRLQCLGNAVVPYQVYPIFKAIADIENEKKGELC